MSRGPAATLLALGLGERKQVGPRLGFRRNAIPKVLDELNSLFKTQVKQVGDSEGVHVWNVAPGDSGENGTEKVR